MSDAIEERIFCVMSWCFMLRAANEGADLVRATHSSEVTDLLNPPGRKSVIDRVGNNVIIRLKSRKNSFSGDCIIRECTCLCQKGSSAYIPPSLCVVHVLWGWIVRRTHPGSRIFCESIVKRASCWLRVALDVRNVHHAEKYGLHSLRRGAATTLASSGCSLAVLLKAGGWRSGAFQAHLDLAGLEKKFFSSSTGTLLNVDEDFAE